MLQTNYINSYAFTGSGDDVTKLSDKLDTFKERYSGLNDKAEARLAQMETALPLATSVQDAHEKLLDWLQVIEPELRGKEPTGAEAEQQIQVGATTNSPTNTCSSA